MTDTTPTLDEVAALDDHDSREVESELIEQTDNGPRDTDGDQPDGTGEDQRADLVDDDADWSPA